jgi:hypothetical protein
LTYLYENLLPERFQHLCQAVLTTVFPDVQCLPVGQPDGGRDAYWRHSTQQQGSKFTIFQVKFVRTPEKERADEKFEEWVKSEKPKIEKLKEWGATKYYLITNQGGTGHFLGGSIDKINDLLTENLGIEATCWWRGDIDRRIEANSDIKWSFPEIIRGSDVLQLLLERLPVNYENKIAAIRAFLAAQYVDDEEVRFKQVELQNKLLDLFVDVPMSSNPRRGQGRKGEIYYIEDDLNIYREGVTRDIKAAATLLNSEIQSGFPKVVLEGAPGQGKSTITQFVCQIHRMRILNYTHSLSQVPEHFLASEVRIPVRVDLRDFATWLGGKNPFPAEQHPERVANQSLESFVVALIEHNSGGHAFSVADLAAVAAGGKILLVLDGFDEVAEVATRHRVVEEVSRAARRLNASAGRVSIIVTSRPAAFANSPGFPEKDWPHFELTSLSRGDVEEYAEKWMDANKLSERDRTQLKSALADKMDQPHMRDLARNPMQLTILLSLVHSRGPSLPEKRTALYDKYIDLFMSREAEKSSVIKEFQEVIVDFHRMLAWIVHASAEVANSSGSIGESELKTLLRSYLEIEGHDAGVVDRLFTGVVERVFMLVSRVEGTFEFEVQPLREYFAARHLYETAPYSPPGAEQHGTKPDRFDALARSSFWLNVTRFYCGCYSRGELSALVDGIEQLAKDEEHGCLSFPRQLAMLLLSDWVFSQQPNLVKRLVAFVTEENGFTTLCSGVFAPRHRLEISLPEKTGRPEFREAAMSRILQVSQEDQLNAISQAIRQNSDLGERISFWLAHRPVKGELKQWVAKGDALGLFRDMEAAAIASIAVGIEGAVAPVLLGNARFDVLTLSSELFGRALEYALDNPIDLYFDLHQRRSDNTSLAVSKFFSALTPRSYAIDRNVRDRYSFRRLGAEAGPADLIAALPSFIQGAPEFLRAAEIARKTPENIWSTTIAPWSHVVEVARSIWGRDRWTLQCLAMMSAGIRSKAEKGDEHSLDEEGAPICERLRYARLRSGDAAWWSKQLSGPDSVAPSLAVFAASTWASPKAMLDLSRELGSKLDALDSASWVKLASSVAQVREYTSQSGVRFEASKYYPALRKMSVRIRSLLLPRVGSRSRLAIARNCLADYEGVDTVVLQAVVDIAIEIATETPSQWGPTLEKVKHAYSLGVAPNYRAFLVSEQLSRTIPRSEARRVLATPMAYPSTLVAAAERSESNRVRKTTKPVGKVAESGNWFDATTSALMNIKGA